MKLSPETAIIVVDTQNDFARPDGKLAVPGGEGVIRPINRLTQAARQLGALVIFTRDYHPAQTPHFNEWPEHCVANTEGAELHPRLKVRRGDIIMDKGQGQTDGYSGFEATTEQGKTMANVLKKANITGVVVCGLATDYCVKATALDAVKNGLNVTLATDAIAAVNINPSDGRKAIKAMKRAGTTTMTVKQITS